MKIIAKKFGSLIFILDFCKRNKVVIITNRCLCRAKTGRATDLYEDKREKNRLSESTALHYINY